MLRIDRSACLVATDDVASRFLSLGQRIVMRGAQALVVLRIDEQIPIPFMSATVVDDRGWCDPAGLLAPLAYGMAGKLC
jgi:hypothetical protein